MYHEEVYRNKQLANQPWQERAFALTHSAQFHFNISFVFLEYKDSFRVEKTDYL